MVPRAMLLLPFAIGMEAGRPTWYHIPLFIGWILLYLATFPILTAIKRRTTAPYLPSFLFIIPALLTLGITIWKDWHLILFGLLMVPFFLVNIYFARKNQERSFLNDLSTVGSFGVGGLASYFLGTGQLDQRAITVWIITMLFFIGSIFFVKSMIREKSNITFRWIAWGYHLLVVAVSFIVGFAWLSLAFLPSTIRAVFLQKIYVDDECRRNHRNCEFCLLFSYGLLFSVMFTLNRDWSVGVAE